MHQKKSTQHCNVKEQEEVNEGKNSKNESKNDYCVNCEAASEAAKIVSRRRRKHKKYIRENATNAYGITK